MRLIAALAVCCLSLAARDFSPVWFEKGRDGMWRSHGSDISVELGHGRLRVDGLEVQFRNGHAGSARPDNPGVVRRISTGHVETGQIASTLSLPAVWPGIDARLSFREGRLKLDWLLAPGARLANIRFRVSGLRSEVLDSGDLGAGTTFRLLRPVAFQAGREVAMRWHIDPQGWAGYHSGQYDPAMPLEIDPYLVAWAGSFGGTGLDIVRATAIDGAGYVYLAGYTDSTSMFSSPRRPSKGGTDAFVLKYLPGTSQIAWATYVGGSAYDSAAAVTVDTAGNIWVTGSTSSSDFPQTNPRFHQGDHDVFTIRLDLGGGLAFSTLVGGSLADKATAIALNSAGDVWIAGETKSPDFPVSWAKQAAFGGVQDGFLMRLSTNGAILYSSFWGGSGTDSVRALAIDRNGDLVIAGTTTSANFPVVNPAQGARAGATDAFVSRFSFDGVAVRFSTYLGGVEADAAFPESANGIAVDATGNTWVAGTTASKTFPSVAPVQAVAGGGTTDAFIARHDRNGALTFSSAFGGNGSDGANTVGVAPDGTVLVAGDTSSSDLPLTDAIGVFGGLTDGFVLRLSGSPVTILWSTYLGGAGTDSVGALALFGSMLYVAGTTDTRFLATASLAGRVDTWTAGITLTSSYGVTITPSALAAGYVVAGTGCDPGSWTGTRAFQWAPGAACTVSPSAVTVSGGTRWRGVTASQTFQAVPWLSSIPLTYATDYLLTRSVNPPGAGSATATPASSDGWYAAGTTVQLTATAAPGYTFTGWTGVPANGSAVLNGPLTATANFGCTASLSSTTSSVGEPTGTASIDVSTGTGCTWSTSSNASWLTLTTAANRTGSGTVTVNVAGNTGAARDGTISVAGQAWTVRQAACSYSLTSGSASVSDSGGPASVTVSTGAACNWNASSNTPWITMNGSADRTGPGSVSVSVGVNTGGARTGTVSVAGQTWTVSQSAPGCTVTMDLSKIGIIPVGGQAYTVPLTASGPNCSSWSLTPNALWIELNPISGNAATKEVVVTAYPNFGAQPRIGTFTAGSQTRSISQAGSSLPESTRFIQLAFFGSLGRMPTAAEISDNSPKDRTSVITDLFSSVEFNTTSRFIAGLYVGLLNRDPEYGGWRYQRTNLNAGVVKQTNIVGTFINSPEYGLRWGNPTPAEFVRLLYRYILLREGTEEEVAWQVGNLGSATTDDKIAMARNFLNSQEFRIGAGPRLTAFLLFAAVLARDGVPEERTFMANAIKADVPISVMITSFVGSAEMAEILK